MMTILLFLQFFVQDNQLNLTAEQLYSEGDSQYYQSNYEEAIHFYLEAFRSFKEEKDTVGQSKSLNDAGLAFLNQGILDSALYYFDRAYLLDKRLQDTLKMASRLVNIGNTYKRIGQNVNGVEAYLLSAEFAEKVEAYKVEARAYNGIGNLYLDQYESRKALMYYQLAYQIHSERSNSALSIAIVLGNIGSAYFQLEAIDSAFYYTHQALRIKVVEGNALSIAYTLEELARFHMEINHLDSANYYLTESMRIRKEQADQQGMASVSAMQARYFLESNQLQRFLDKVNDALSYADTYQDRELQLYCYALLIRYHKDLGNWESAYYFRTNSAALRDSLFNEEKLKVNQIIAEQQIQEKEQERLLARQQANLAEVQSEQQEIFARNYLIIAAVLGVVLLLTAIGLIVIKRQQRSVKGLNIELSRSNEKIKRLNKQNMHFTKNALSEITGLLNIQSKKLEGVAKELMQGAKLRLDTINILYNLLFNLKGKEEGHVNLAVLIEKILDNTIDAMVSEKRLPVKSYDFDQTLVSSETALNVGLIANELCINACKYAFTKPDVKLEVKLSCANEVVVFTFIDSGPGFPDNFDWRQSKSFGLQLIILLAEDMSSHLIMENHRQGLKIELTIPNT